MKKLVVIAAVVMGFSHIAQAQIDPKSNSGSIYGTQPYDLYLDRVARKKGDLLLVMIDENSVSNFAAATNTGKQVSNSTASSVLNLFNWAFGPFTNSVAHTNAGTGNTNQTSNMTARVSVLVKDLDAGGNLIIEGNRTLITNKETQTFVLTGLVRPFDIAPDNTIPSSKIANAKIEMAGKGQIAERQRKGFLTTILDWIF